jgi:hypothetical protein
MNDQIHLQSQAIHFRDLLEKAGDDPVIAAQARVRLEGIEKKLEALRLQPGTLYPEDFVVLPRAAVFLGGGGVKGHEGIRPSLAGDALIQYEKMFVEQALHDEREAARKAGGRRRKKGSPAPELLFSDTHQGSFGLEFVPQRNNDRAVLELHAKSLRHVADAVVAVTEGEGRPLDEVVRNIPAGVLKPLQSFLKTLAKHGAEVRFAFPDDAGETLSREKIQRAADRLDKDVRQEFMDCQGVIRGIAMESGVFDFNPDDGKTISGIVADSLTEEDLLRIIGLTNKRCEARLQQTSVEQVAGNFSRSYVLLDAAPLETIA